MGAEQSKQAWAATFTERFKELIGDTPYRVLSDRLDISKSTISAYVTGERSPKVTVLKSIASSYGVDVLWLMGMDVPKYKETPDVSVEGMNEDRAQLIQIINQMSDDQVRALRAIADQVLSLREK